MAQVKPDEISAILREQLSGYKSAAELEEVGTVLQVGDGIARLYGLTKVQAGELIEFENGTRAVVLNLEEDNVGAVMLGAGEGRARPAVFAVAHQLGPALAQFEQGGEQAQPRAAALAGAGLSEDAKQGGVMLHGGFSDNCS